MKVCSVFFQIENERERLIQYDIQICLQTARISQCVVKIHMPPISDGHQLKSIQIT